MNKQCKAMSPCVSKVINVLETEDTKIWKCHIPQSTQAIIDGICFYGPFVRTVLCQSENHHIHISINMPSVINKFWKLKPPPQSSHQLDFTSFSLDYGLKRAKYFYPVYQWIVLFVLAPRSLCWGHFHLQYFKYIAMSNMGKK